MRGKENKSSPLFSPDNPCSRQRKQSMKSPPPPPPHQLTAPLSNHPNSLPSSLPLFPLSYLNSLLTRANAALVQPTVDCAAAAGLHLRTLLYPFPSVGSTLPPGVENISPLPPSKCHKIDIASLLTRPDHDHLLRLHRPDAIIADTRLPRTTAIVHDLSIPRPPSTYSASSPSASWAPSSAAFLHTPFLPRSSSLPPAPPSSTSSMPSSAFSPASPSLPPPTQSPIPSPPTLATSNPSPASSSTLHPRHLPHLQTSPPLLRPRQHHRHPRSCPCLVLHL